MTKKQKQPGKLELLRNEKYALHRQIAEKVVAIKGALNASRVPPHVVNGDHAVAVAWKNAMESTASLYHVRRPSTKRATVPQLSAILERLNAALKSIT